MNITSRQLKAFVLTARHQSFSRAADEFFITQSGMSVLVRELEAQLGFRLFERTTRKVKLTPFGEQFLPAAGRSLLELEVAAAAINRAAAAAGGEVSIGATPAVAADLLPPAIAAYALRNPRLHVRVIDAESLRLIEMVRTGSIDIALSAFRQAAPDLLRIALMPFSLMLVSAHDDATGLPPRLRWSDVAKRRMVGLPPDNPLQQLVGERLLRAGRRTPPDIVCNFLETQVAMVEAGAGVAVVPSLAMPTCRKRRVALHALTDPVVCDMLYWVASQARPLPAPAEAFSAFLKEFLRALPVALLDDGGAEHGRRIVRDDAAGSALQR